LQQLRRKGLGGRAKRELDWLEKGEVVVVALVPSRFFSLVQVLAAVVSPLMFPNLYSLVQPVKFGLFDLLTLGPGVVFLIATGVLLVACVIAGTLPKTAPEVAEVPDTQWHTTPTATDAAAAAVVNNNGY